MKFLDNKVALVTGASQANGIGFATCQKLADAGAKVIISDWVRTVEEQERLDARVADICASGGTAVGLSLNVTSLAEAKQVVAKAVDMFGSLDILFNNAGYPGGVGAFLELADQEWDLSYQVNVKGVVNLCRAAIPVMQSQGGGAIINNASLAGLGTIGKFSAYTATKFAIVGITKDLACEFGADHIRINAVCPGLVWTDMGKKEAEHFRQEEHSLDETKQAMAADVPVQRWANPTEVGDAVVYLASPQASYITGVALPIAGGLAPGL